MSSIGDTFNAQHRDMVGISAMTRAVADGLTEPADRRSMLDIVTDHERWASYDVTGIEPARWFGAYPFAAWW